MAHNVPSRKACVSRSRRQHSSHRRSARVCRISILHEHCAARSACPQGHRSPAARLRTQTPVPVHFRRRSRLWSDSNEDCRQTRSFAADLNQSLLEGSPPDAILESAYTEKVKLIVMGIQTRGALDRIRFGSTTRRVIRAAVCPVLSIRADRAAVPGPAWPPIADEEGSGAAWH